MIRLQLNSVCNSSIFIHSLSTILPFATVGNVIHTRKPYLLQEHFNLYNTHVYIVWDVMRSILCQINKLRKREQKHVD